MAVNIRWRLYDIYIISCAEANNGHVFCTVIIKGDYPYPLQVVIMYPAGKGDIGYLVAVE